MHLGIPSKRGESMGQAFGPTAIDYHWIPVNKPVFFEGQGATVAEKGGTEPGFSEAKEVSRASTFMSRTSLGTM